METRVAIASALLCWTVGASAQPADVVTTWTHDPDGRLIGFEGISNGKKIKVDVWGRDDTGQPTPVPYAIRVSVVEQQPDGSYRIVPCPWVRVADGSVDPYIPGGGTTCSIDVSAMFRLQGQ